MRTTSFILAAIIAAVITTGTSCKSKKAAGDTATVQTSSPGTAKPSDSSTETSQTSTPGVSISTTGSSSESATNTTVTPGKGAYTGKVSHKYHSTGCPSVIIFTGEDGHEMTLIPKDALNKDIDMDGQTISFDYHVLKMPQPAGCTTGVPAEITNIVRLK
jgi:hypothetical protein